MKRRAAGSIGLISIGAVLLVRAAVLADAPRSGPSYGVSSVQGSPGIAIHWVLCDGQRAESVSLDGYGGAYPRTDVPIYWQVRSTTRARREGARIETYIAGQTPDGFYETVPFRQGLPNDLISIDGPPGGERSMEGMSFDAGDVRVDAIYTGEYEHVSADDFANAGLASCGGNSDRSAAALGLVLIALGWLTLAGLRRPTAALIATTVAVLGIAGLAGDTLAEHLATSRLGGSQSPSAFARGSTEPPSDREVLLDMSPRTHTSRGLGIFAARVNAPGAYALAVTCEGPSIQIGEASKLVDGYTGNRQLVGCAAGRPVRGSLSARSDRSSIVDIIVNPNGMADWRVVVIEGGGQLGPFDDN